MRTTSSSLGLLGELGKFGDFARCGGVCANKEPRIAQLRAAARNGDGFVIDPSDRIRERSRLKILKGECLLIGPVAGSSL